MANQIQPKFIAEVSSNHNQDLARCLQFVDLAADIGCHGVKFQLFKISELFSKEILSKSEQHRQRAKWELAVELIPDIAARCKARNLQFGCTPFYLKAVSELTPYVDFFKISSYELLWTPLLDACANTDKALIVSTGMATLAEVNAAIKPIKDKVSDLTLLHCVSAYPTPVEQANLAAIKTLRDEIGVKVGWSDHTVSPGVLHRAVHHWQAEVVEFHLDIDATGEEYQGGHCWLPEQIAPVISEIQSGLLADGSAEKKPANNEMPDRMWRADPDDGLRPLKATRASWTTQ